MSYFGTSLLSSRIKLVAQEIPQNPNLEKIHAIKTGRKV
jgi:hypothetical protein